ncbi:Predicted transcriptional regulator, ArsR family [Paraoerskovia marina]|uniref:Predicted transcriptional regulator, ArsR family n=2 Tax=Paraoerskovia marina TaxID=545619 RepID=A0A1H1TGF6_9CELL|nr:Predicted transcriptional regulator, ArsR family [Paraoerskovia marina]
MAVRRALASERRVALLDLLDGRDGTTVDDLAAATDQHPNTVREHLSVLARAGLVTSEPEPRAVRGRPRRLYRSRPRPDQDQTAEARGHADQAVRTALTRVLLDGFGTDEPDPADAARRAGLAVAETLDPTPVQPGTSAVRHLLGHLEDLGFAPETTDDEPRRISLRRCPFLDLAQQRPDVVCAFHLGLAQGLLDHAPGHVAATRLEPFVAPDLCLLDVETRATAADDAQSPR